MAEVKGAELAKKRIADAIAESRLRFEVIINNHFFMKVMNRSKNAGGFPPLRYLEQLLFYTAKETQEGHYSYETLYQLIEVLAYFVYYWKVAIDIKAETWNFLPGQSGNQKIQIKLAMEMLPKNIERLSQNTRLLLAYVTELERNETKKPLYKKHERLFLVEKLISTTKNIPEVKKFEDSYDMEVDSSRSL